MNGLMVFSSKEFGEIRTIEINNEPWFVGKDVAAALGYAKERNAIAAHVLEEDKKDAPVQGAPGGTQQMTIINESGLYALIFGSKLESAKRFKHWVTSEVLPAIRKTGAYEIENISTEMKAILMHDQKIIGIEKRVDKIENDMPLFGCESDELSAHVKRKVVGMLGGKQSGAYMDKTVRTKAFRAMYTGICQEFGVLYDSGTPKSYKNLKRRYLEAAHRYVEEFQAPMYLRELIDGANAQTRMAI